MLVFLSQRWWTYDWSLCHSTTAPHQVVFQDILRRVLWTLLKRGRRGWRTIGTNDAFRGTHNGPIGMRRMNNQSVEALQKQCSCILFHFSIIIVCSYLVLRGAYHLQAYMRTCLNYCTYNNAIRDFLISLWIMLWTLYYRFRAVTVPAPAFCAIFWNLYIVETRSVCLICWHDVVNKAGEMQETIKIEMGMLKLQTQHVAGQKHFRCYRNKSRQQERREKNFYGMLWIMFCQQQ